MKQKDETTTKNIKEISHLVHGAILSTHKEAIEHNKILHEEVKKCRKEVEDDVFEIIEAMGLAFDQKNESIDTLRRWRKTIERESKMAASAVDSIMKNISTKKINELREFVELIERVNKINPSLILNKLFREA